MRYRGTFFGTNSAPITQELVFIQELGLKADRTRAKGKTMLIPVESELQLSDKLLFLKRSQF